MDKIPPNWSGCSFPLRTVPCVTAALLIGCGKTTSSMSLCVEPERNFLPVKVRFVMEICRNVLALMAEATIPFLIKILHVIIKRWLLHLFWDFSLKINQHNAFILMYALFVEKHFICSLCWEFVSYWEKKGLERFDPWLLPSSFLCVVTAKSKTVALFSHYSTDNLEHKMSLLESQPQQTHTHAALCTLSLLRFPRSLQYLRYIWMKHGFSKFASVQKQRQKNLV